MITDDFVAYAGRIHAHFDEPRSGPEIKSLVTGAISYIAVRCMEEGATLIGHIKCLAEVDSGRFLACSVVTAGSEPTCRGEVDVSKGIEVILNVLLYGLTRDKVEAVVKRSLQVIFKADGARAEIEDLEFLDHENSGHAHAHEHCD